MAQQSGPGMTPENWQRLQELLNEAQDGGMVGDALQLIGLEEGAAHWVSNRVDQAARQAVVQPKSKARVASRNPADYSGSDATDLGYEMVDQGTMSDASKRLSAAMDDTVGDMSAGHEAATPDPPAAMPMMNRVRRALVANNSEAVPFSTATTRQHSEVRDVGVAERGANVPRVAMTSLEALHAANPVISLQEPCSTTPNSIIHIPLFQCFIPY